MRWRNRRRVERVRLMEWFEFGLGWGERGGEEEDDRDGADDLVAVLGVGEGGSGFPGSLRGGRMIEKREKISLKKLICRDENG